MDGGPNLTTSPQENENERNRLALQKQLQMLGLPSNSGKPNPLSRNTSAISGTSTDWSVAGSTTPGPSSVNFGGSTGSGGRGQKGNGKAKVPDLSSLDPNQRNQLLQMFRAQQQQQQQQQQSQQTNNGIQTQDDMRRLVEQMRARQQQQQQQQQQQHNGGTRPSSIANLQGNRGGLDMAQFSQLSDEQKQTLTLYLVQQMQMQQQQQQRQNNQDK